MSAAYVITEAWLRELAAWSRETFGPGQRTDAVLDHLAKELEEVRAAPEDASEWADVLLLAFDGAARAGHSPEEIIEALWTKYSVNTTRTWPDWRTQDPTKAIEHVREATR
jgi:hypothetical protein